jgi:hypothetical protein
MTINMVFLRLLLVLSPLVSLTIGAPLEGEWTHVSASKILLPKDDIFYQPKAGFEKAKLGTILSYRKVPNAITLDNKNPIVPKSAWQINYRTQNSVGEPEQTMVTILEPFNAKPDSLFVYHFFSVGIQITSIYGCFVANDRFDRTQRMMGRLKIIMYNDYRGGNLCLVAILPNRSRSALERTTLSHSFKHTSSSQHLIEDGM